MSHQEEHPSRVPKVSRLIESSNFSVIREQRVVALQDPLDPERWITVPMHEVLGSLLEFVEEQVEFDD